MWAGIAGAVVNNNSSFEIAISIHDSVYNTDFASSIIPYNPNDPEEQAANIEKHVLDVLRKFSTEHMCKFLGAGVTVALLREVRCIHPVSCLSTSKFMPSRLGLCGYCILSGSFGIGTLAPCASTASAARKPERP